MQVEQTEGAPNSTKIIGAEEPVEDTSIETKRKRPQAEDSENVTFVKITNLKRPFTLKQVQEYLRSHGNLISDTSSCVWLNRTRQVAIAQYVTVEEANRAIEFVNGKVWPPGFGEVLSASLLSPEEARKQMITPDKQGKQARGRGEVDNMNKRRRIAKLLSDVGTKSNAQLGEQVFTRTKPRLMYRTVAANVVQQRKERRLKLATMALRAKIAAKKVALAKKLEASTNQAKAAPVM